MRMRETSAQERGTALEPIVEALAAAFVKLGGSEPFQSTTRAGAQ